MQKTRHCKKNNNSELSLVQDSQKFLILRYSTQIFINWTLKKISWKFLKFPTKILAIYQNIHRSSLRKNIFESFWSSQRHFHKNFSHKKTIEHFFLSSIQKSENKEVKILPQDRKIFEIFTPEKKKQTSLKFLIVAFFSLPLASVCITKLWNVSSIFFLLEKRRK